MNLTSIMTTSMALVLGFLTGLLTFKRSQRWCPQCGTTLSCPACHQPRTARPAAPPGAPGRAAADSKVQKTWPVTNRQQEHGAQR